MLARPWAQGQRGRSGGEGKAPAQGKGQTEERLAHPPAVNRQRDTPETPL
jgi:hypothetical protein